MGTMNIWNKKLLIFGGMSNRAHPFVHKLDIKTKHWSDEELSMEKAYPQSFRLGHTANILNKMLFIFGGELRDPLSKHSTITNDFL